MTRGIAGSPKSGSVFTAFLRDERGATAIEYGLICGLIFVVVVGAATTFGNLTTALIQRVSNAIAVTVG